MFELAKVRTILDQQSIINETTDLTLLRKVHAAHFRDPGGKYDEKLTDFDRRRLSPQEYYGLVAFNEFLAAQYGFTYLIGGVDRHTGSRSFFDPKHQIAIAVYLAKINEQAWRIKSNAIRKLRQIDRDQDVAPGIWAVHLPVKGGKVSELSGGVNALIDDALIRRRQELPICQPMADIFPRIARLPISAQIADTISDQDFTTKYLPMCRMAFAPYVDITKALGR